MTFKRLSKGQSFFDFLISHHGTLEGSIAEFFKLNPSIVSINQSDYYAVNDEIISPETVVEAYTFSFTQDPNIIIS